MPTYEYQCTDTECNHIVEFMQKMSEDPIEFCPHCGQKSLKKKTIKEKLFEIGFKEK